MEDVLDLLSITYILKNEVNEKAELVIDKIIMANKLLNRNSIDDCSSSLPINRISGLYNERIFLLEFDEIIYLRADGDFTDIISKNGMTYKSKFSLKYLSEKLRGTSFFRCHKSFLVNIQNVREISPYFNYTFELTCSNCAEKVPVGRKYIKEFKELVGL